MGLFHHDSEEFRASVQINECTEGGNQHHHKAKISHELLSGAAAYEAAKAYEDHKKKHGKPSDHAQAKQIACGLAGAWVDRVVETRGLDFVDKEKTKRAARIRVESAIDENGY